jgi:hypothetical protein
LRRAKNAMLDSKTIKSIEQFLKPKPRTIQEVAFHIKKNWRTADRYVEKIAEDTGSIATRTFREGTRGALKIAFWQALDAVHGSGLQQRLASMIEHGRTKYDFSPLELYQYVDAKKKRAFMEEQFDEQASIEHELISHLQSAQKQVLFFSGNLSFVNVVQDGIKLIDVLEDLARQNVPIKFLARIDITAIKNLKKILAINNKLGKEMIEVRHSVQPLRSFVVDNRFARFKETQSTAHVKKHELERQTCIFYEIYEPEWVEWTQKIFWNLFRTAVPAQKRLENLEAIQKLVR